MKERNYKRIEVFAFYALLLFTAAWFFFYINKGIDVTDTAYYLARYKYYFEPSVKVKSMGTFLNDLLGAAIYSISGTHQVLILSICHWMLYMGSGVVVFFTLKKYVPRILLLFSIFCGSLFSLTWIHVMNHNATSMFLFTLGACILFKGIEQEKVSYYVWAGFVLGINTFFRLPNVLQIAIGICILWYYGCCKNEWKTGFINCVKYAAGVISGWILGAILAFSVIGKSSIMSYFVKTTNMASSSESSHGILNILINLVKGLVHGAIHWAKYGAILVVVCVLLTLALTKYQEYFKHKSKMMYAILSFVSIYALFVSTKLEYRELFQMLALCILGVMAIACLLFRQSNSLMSAICAMTLVAEAVFAIGTDNAWYFQAIFMIFPLAICVLVVYKLENKLLQKNAIVCAVFVGCLMAAVGGRYATQYIYRDAQSQYLTSEINAEEYADIYTQVGRAECLNQMESILESLDEEYLLSYGDCNIPYVITDKKPFLNKIWIDLASYSEAAFEKDLEKSLKSKGNPIILIADIDQDDRFRSEEKLAMIQEVIDENGYSVYYEDMYLTIYTIAE